MNNQKSKIIETEMWECKPVEWEMEVGFTIHHDRLNELLFYGVETAGRIRLKTFKVEVYFYRLESFSVEILHKMCDKNAVACKSK